MSALQDIGVDAKLIVDDGLRLALESIYVSEKMPTTIIYNENINVFSILRNFSSRRVYCGRACTLLQHKSETQLFNSQRDMAK